MDAVLKGINCYNALCTQRHCLLKKPKFKFLGKILLLQKISHAINVKLNKQNGGNKNESCKQHFLRIISRVA